MLILTQVEKTFYINKTFSFISLQPHWPLYSSDTPPMCLLQGLCTTIPLARNMPSADICVVHFHTSGLCSDVTSERPSVSVLLCLCSPLCWLSLTPQFCSILLCPAMYSLFCSCRWNMNTKRLQLYCFVHCYTCSRWKRTWHLVAAYMCWLDAWLEDGWLYPFSNLLRTVLCQASC